MTNALRFYFSVCLMAASPIVGLAVWMVLSRFGVAEWAAAFGGIVSTAVHGFGTFGLALTYSDRLGGAD